MKPLICIALTLIRPITLQVAMSRSVSEPFVDPMIISDDAFILSKQVY